MGWLRIVNRCEKEFLSRREGSEIFLIFSNSTDCLFTCASNDRACCRSCAQPVPTEADMSCSEKKRGTEDAKSEHLMGGSAY